MGCLACGFGGQNVTLEVRDLVKRFDGVRAVDGVSFTVNAGECVALIGPNGAGKSTTFACIAGQVLASSGELHWRGQVMGRWSAQHRLVQGIARTFQVAQVFEALSVLENVQLLLQRPLGFQAWRPLEPRLHRAAMDLLMRVALHDAAHQPARNLPYGARKRLELAMALAGLPVGAGPQMLLLDEPAAGLSATEREQMMALVKSLSRASDTSLAVLYTEHNMDAVFGVADRVLVLMQGRLVAQGDPATVAADPLVREGYLGRDFRRGMNA
jgi:branched-chain amino acid transport system ATP-binding protein